VVEDNVTVAVIGFSLVLKVFILGRGNS